MTKQMEKTNKYLAMQQSINVIIAGGGTGGHVFPAIAIGKALKNKPYNANILFVGARGKLEMEKVPQAGFKIEGLSILGIQRRLTWKNLLVPFRLVGSMIKARKIIRRFKPDVVIGVGGYASGPIVRAAASKGIPTLIQEQNSYPGLTNRILAKKAMKICVAYEGMEAYFDKSKLYVTGNPIRQDLVNPEAKREEALAFFGLSSDKPVVLITGGSLGARTINEATARHLQQVHQAGIQLIWQTGSHGIDMARTHLGKEQVEGVYVHAFIDRMDYAYAAADMVVSRAGAIAVSEICAVRKPAVFIPSPNVAEDHQTKNAMTLVNNHAAVIIKDGEAIEKLGPVIIDLMYNEEEKQKLKERIASLAYRNAADVIAEAAVGLVKGNKK